MRFGLAVTLAVALMSAGCGVEVPAGLEDKLKACPGMAEPEPVAILTKGHEVTDVKLERGALCIVNAQGDRPVLDIGLIEYPSQEMAERQASVTCPAGEWNATDKSCVAAPADTGRLIVRGVAGRFEVRVAAYEVSVTDETKDAAYQILKDLRSSDRTK